MTAAAIDLSAIEMPLNPLSVSSQCSNGLVSVDLRSLFNLASKSLTSTGLIKNGPVWGLRAIRNSRMASGGHCNYYNLFMNIMKGTVLRFKQIAANDSISWILGRHYLRIYPRWQVWEPHDSTWRQVTRNLPLVTAGFGGVLPVIRIVIGLMNADPWRVDESKIQRVQQPGFRLPTILGHNGGQW